MQIGDQVFRVFNANRVTDQGFGDTAGLALLGRGLYVAGGGGRAGDGFDRSEVGGEMGVAQAGKQFLDRRETALQNETEDATIPAHLAARDVMIFVRLQAGIKHGCDLRLRLQETGDLERALVLLANAEVQGLHSAQQQVGGHGVEASSRNFAEMVNAAHQVTATTDHSA